MPRPAQPTLAKLLCLEDGEDWRPHLRAAAAFWILGCINNSAYVIMLAGANEVSSGSVGLVYFCAIAPTIIVKLTAPYWFHLVAYLVRMWAVAALMSAAYMTVALSSTRPKQLAGVALAALQGGLGEATALGLCARYHSRSALTTWSSGTGFAGVAGYATVAVLHELMGFTFTATLMVASTTSVLWMATYLCLLPPPTQPMLDGSRPTDARHNRQALPGRIADTSDADDLLATERLLHSSSTLQSGDLDLELSHRSTPDGMESRDEQGWLRRTPSHKAHGITHATSSINQHELRAPHSTDMPSHEHSGGTSDIAASGSCASSAEAEGELDPAQSGPPRGFCGRLHGTLALWPYTIPLFLVYLAEYAMQSGTWTAIGFPTSSAQARHRFYLAANWTYQAGVFISRSSGLLFQANRMVLWVMPVLQCALLSGFTVDAVWHFWYDWGLLVPCLLAGLLGGAVYVNAFTLLAHEVAAPMREFSLSAASIADSLGIACADVLGIVLQGCLFMINRIPGADFACGNG